MPIKTLLASALLISFWAPLLAAVPAWADDGAPQSWSLHAQSTFIEQYHPGFTAPYSGTNSLSPLSIGNEASDITLFGGLRLWDGGEAYINPEMDQGFGLSHTEGVAGFTNDESSKVGSVDPYIRLHRLFLRQTFDLGGDEKPVDDDQNQVAGRHTEDNLMITAGKFSAPDLFDANSYAHDPRHDFLNWSIVESGAYDYAADAWGYSYGVAGELNLDWWSWRLGLFDMSRKPNGRDLVRGFGQYELVTEGEERHTLFGHDGKVKLLLYYNRARMGDYNQAVALALSTHTIPDTSQVARPATRPGGALNLEQGLSDDLGGFVRLSMNDGSEQAYEFTDINRSAALGLSLKGTRWGRADDAVGLAFANNAISRAAQSYFAAGGLGVLVGDGRLNYGTENIVETYYSARLTDWLFASADYQFIANPAYNRDRGPVSVLGARLHAQF